MRLPFFCHMKFCYTTTLAACRIFYLPYFNSLYTLKGPVLLCAPPRHRAMWLNFLAQGKSLPPAGIELGTFGLQRQRSESATLATAPARHTHVSHCASKTHFTVSPQCNTSPCSAEYLRLFFAQQLNIWEPFYNPFLKLYCSAINLPIAKH